MADSARRNILSFLLLAAIAIVLLASALPQLELVPGIPLPDWKSQPGTLPSESVDRVAIPINTLLQVILEVIAVLLIAFITYKFIQGVSWKTILKEIVEPSLMLAFVAMVILGLIFALTRVQVTSPSTEPPVLPPLPRLAGPPLGLPPISLMWLVWIGLGLMGVILAAAFVYWRGEQARTRDPLLLEAQRAVEALRTGLDVRNVIVRCYQQMSLALQKEQGIEREETMTAREFEQQLQARGFPDAPVRQLTLLFEAARYGDRPLSAEDERQALDCLNAIVQYSGARKEAR